MRNNREIPPWTNPEGADSHLLLSPERKPDPTVVYSAKVGVAMQDQPALGEEEEEAGSGRAKNSLCNRLYTSPANKSNYIDLCIIFLL